MALRYGEEDRGLAKIAQVLSFKGLQHESVEDEIRDLAVQWGEAAARAQVGPRYVGVVVPDISPV